MLGQQRRRTARDERQLTFDPGGGAAPGQPAGGRPSLVDLGDKKATALALGDDHTCAIVDDETVRCWGANALGQLGNGTRAESSTPVPVQGITGATAIASDASHTCAVTRAGTFC
ncbi:MAG: hypothetical protein KIT84_31095 [Labilithrix sp.]|nr:hypothetical protein [Labilithrix sp.]MCW5815515.1 hypothetical protein [Labilithrix sp.]